MKFEHKVRVLGYVKQYFVGSLIMLFEFWLYLL